MATIATDHHLHDSSLDGAEQALLNGEAGIVLNRTWVLDSYDALTSDGSRALRSDEVASLSGSDAV